VRTHPVPTALAAELFELNFATWRDEPFVRDSHSRDDLDQLEAELRELARGQSRAPITWGMRQMTFERGS
jgi:hypothetical protein